jgi:hypothetical protein
MIRLDEVLSFYTFYVFINCRMRDKDHSMIGGVCYSILLFLWLNTWKKQPNLIKLTRLANTGVYRLVLIEKVALQVNLERQILIIWKMVTRYSKWNKNMGKSIRRTCDEYVRHVIGLLGKSWEYRRLEIVS